MTPNYQKPIKFINQCNCIVDYVLLEKAMLWYTDSTLHQHHKIYMHGRYPAVSIYNNKIHVHRLLAMFRYKKILLRSIHVHHIDHNKLNSSIKNIKLLKASEHLSCHNKGRKFSKEHKLKLSEAGRRRKGIKMKRLYNIDINDLKLILNKETTINKISKKYGCDWSVVKVRINELSNS